MLFYVGLHSSGGKDITIVKKKKNNLFLHCLIPMIWLYIEETTTLTITLSSLKPARQEISQNLYSHKIEKELHTETILLPDESALLKIEEPPSLLQIAVFLLEYHQTELGVFRILAHPTTAQIEECYKKQDEDNVYLSVEERHLRPR